MAIADAVGIPFEEIEGQAGDFDTRTAETVAVRGSDEPSQYPWASLSESSLKRKSVAEMKGYLAAHDIVLDDSSRILKADLLDAIDGLHNQHNHKS